MSKAVIVSTARTPLTKSWKGAFNMTHGATLGGHAIRHAVERAGIDPATVEDVLMGCANPEGATGWNIARQCGLAAGLPITVSGVTINRFCSSGLQTIATVTHPHRIGVARLDPETDVNTVLIAFTSQSAIERAAALHESSAHAQRFESFGDVQEGIGHVVTRSGL